MFKREDEEQDVTMEVDDMETIIGPSVKVEGNFISNGNIVIEGAVNGTIQTSKDLRVGTEAVIEADVIAENLTTSGKISGTVRVAKNLELKETAHIYGDVEAGILSVETGAVLQGRCISGPQEIAKAAPVTQKKRATKAKTASVVEEDEE